MISLITVPPVLASQDGIAHASSSAPLSANSKLTIESPYPRPYKPQIFYLHKRKDPLLENFIPLNPRNTRTPPAKPHGFAASKKKKRQRRWTTVQVEHVYFAQESSDLLFQLAQPLNYNRLVFSRHFVQIQFIDFALRYPLSSSCHPIPLVDPPVISTRLYNRHITSNTPPG